MKISCQSCQAKYTIADDKVLGKIVKIRCKKCSATIVINGNEAAASAPAVGSDANVFDYTAQGSAEQWTVNVADGDQRTMTSVEIESAYRSGVVNDETFCWKDGMGDWLPLREIEALYAACTMGPRPSLAPEQSHHEAHDEQPTAIQSTNLGSLFGSASSGGGGAASQSEIPTSVGVSLDAGNGAQALFGGPAVAPVSSGGASAAAAAARRAGGRGAQGADLFGGVARAGGEEDVMTSLSPSGFPAAHGAGSAADKMTGQRNENSVLFSLSALSNNPNAPKEDHPLPPGEGSGLIDIRALSGMQPQEGPKQNRADDIMNLGGGGAFTPALSAPILGASSMDTTDYAAAAAEGNEAADGKNKKTLLIAIIASCSLIAVAILVVVLLSMKSSEPSVASTTPTGTSTTTTAPTATATATTATTATATETATTATASALPPPTATVTATATTATATATTTATTKPTVTATATTATATATENNSPPFNLEAAKNALRASSAAAGGCGKPGGPTGSGSVLVMFRGNGSVSSAQVQGPPFAGTPVGGCVAQRFYGAHIPAFSGGAPPLTKSFTVN